MTRNWPRRASRWRVRSNVNRIVTSRRRDFGTMASSIRGTRERCWRFRYRRRTIGPWKGRWSGAYSGTRFLFQKAFDAALAVFRRPGDSVGLDAGFESGFKTHGVRVV